jgi:manganese/iron transport system permease protein
MMHWLLEPLQYPFMRHGLLMAMLIGVTCAVLGVYVVLRRMAFIGDALAHSILPGMVVAYLNHWNLFAGAVGAGLFTAFGIGYVSHRTTLHEDTAIGILFTGMFALGIVFMHTTQSFRDLSHLLFGNILGVTTTDLCLMTAIAGLVLSLLGMFHKELELTSVDPLYAAVIGVQADLVQYGLLVLLVLTVVAGLQAVGVLLTSALLITPAATAALLTTRLARMLLLAVLLASGASIIGLYASFYLQVSSGAAMVLTSTLCFVLTWGSQTVRRAWQGSARLPRPPIR